MDEKYICPQCAAKYDAPGACETCQVPLQAPDEADELEGFQTDEEEEEDDDDELAEEDFGIEAEDEEVSAESEDDEYATDTYEDQDNY